MRKGATAWIRDRCGAGRSERCRRVCVCTQSDGLELDQVCQGGTTGSQNWVSCFASSEDADVDL